VAHVRRCGSYQGEEEEVKARALIALVTISALVSSIAAGFADGR
jgi:hypothetical protein